jgi:hypothetical protein
MGPSQWYTCGKWNEGMGRGKPLKTKLVILAGATLLALVFGSIGVVAAARQADATTAVGKTSTLSLSKSAVFERTSSFDRPRTTSSGQKRAYKRSYFSKCDCSTNTAHGIAVQQGEPVHRVAHAIEDNSLPPVPPAGSATIITNANTRFRVHDAEEPRLDDFAGRVQRPEALDQTESVSFTFAVAADMRYFSGPTLYNTPQFFRGAVEAIAAAGGGAFMISPGDIDPPDNVLWTIRQTMGVTYTWYPVIGNHELPGKDHESEYGANLAWLNGYDYGEVNVGPSGCPTTTYSFDHSNAHFVVLNEYCDSSGDDVTTGDVTDHVYEWLVSDLENTTQEHVFVFGHEPAYPQPDADNGRSRHVGDSLDEYPDRRDRFWGLLREKEVVAYICGHTHNYSAVRIEGVWQLDVGHARGLADTGAQSTFALIEVGEGFVRYEVYRDDASGGSYSRRHMGYFQAVDEVFLPLVVNG